ncbi:MAG: multidrug ABC transporter [Oscillospiraceae bacterium]|nr:multidrug ABC transporter [Oscillospiraceae bacterium]
MDKTTLFYALLCLAGVFISSVSQVLLKKSAMKHYGSALREYLNPLVIGAYAIFFGATLMNVLAYRGIPLSLGPVLEATSYLYVTFFGVTIFKEKLTPKKVLALALILGGIVLYAVSG